MTDKVFTSLFQLCFDGYLFYADTQQAIENYYYRKLHPGGFVYALLCNDLVGAASRADTWNKEKLAEYAMWLDLQMPRSAWGDKETVDAWLRSDANAV